MLKQIIKPTLILSALVCTTFLGGCDPAVNEEYKGEPIITLKGQITNALESNIDELDVRLSWAKIDIDENGDASGVSILAEQVDVEGSFPAEYKISVFEPPVESAFVDLPIGEEGVRLAMGYITASVRGEEFKLDEIVGLQDDFVVFYVDDVKVIELFRERMNQELEFGYNLFQAYAPKPQIFDECIDAYIMASNSCTNVNEDLCFQQFHRDFPLAREIELNDDWSYDRFCSPYLGDLVADPSEVDLNMRLSSNVYQRSNLNRLILELEQTAEHINSENEDDIVYDAGSSD